MDDSALIFSNLLNGVPVGQVAATFHKQSEEEVMKVFTFVLKKVKSYAFERRMPSILASTVDEAKRYRLQCLAILPKLNLARDPKYGNIVSELVTGSNAMAIAKELGA